MRWLLRWLVSDADRQTIENDLVELYEFRRRHDGERAARRWLRRQRAIYPLYLFWERLRSFAGHVAGRGGIMSGITRDLAHSLRSLRRSPGLAATIVLTVGLGLGATATMMTVIHAVVMRPLPYADQDALVWIYSDRPPYQSPISVADYRTIDEQQTSFSHLAGFQATSVTLSGGAAASRVSSRNVTWQYFSTLGLQPALGRLFDKSDDVAGRRLAVLSHDFWTTEFGADRSVLGRTVAIDGISHTVIGVVEPDRGPVGRGVAVFRPIHWEPPPRKGPFFIRAIARVKPGVTRAVALEELHAINKRMFPTWQVSFQDSDVTFGLVDLKTRVVGTVTSTLVFVLAAVGSVLLIACTNAVNLLLARAMRRGSELTIRTALGASRRRILQYLAAETLLLTLASAVLGCAIAVGALQLVRTYGANYIPRIDEIRFGMTAMSWLALLSCASAGVIGLVPAIQGARAASRHHLPAASRTSTDSRAARRLRRLLIGAEFAMATPLVIAAALVLTSLDRLRDVPVGVDTASILTAGIALPSGPYPDQASMRVFWDRLLERLAAMPGVDAVTLADSRPPSEVAQANNFNLEDRPTPAGRMQPTCPWVGVVPGHFKTLGLTLQEGRLLDASDFAGGAAAVVVVDRAWAEQYFPHERVLGRRFRGGGCTTCPWTTVVGVVSTVKYVGLTAPDQGTVYWPMGNFDRNRFILIRSVRPAELATPLGHAVRELDPNLALTGISTVDDLVTDSLATPRYLSVLVATFGAAALSLSIVGIYGVMAYFVQQHRRDIAIRLALGGEPSRLRRAVIGQGLAIVAAGVVVGIAIAFVSARLLTSVLFGVTPTDPMTMVLVPSVLMSAALIACAIPARRAAAVQPAEVLRDA